MVVVNDVDDCWQEESSSARVGDREDVDAGKTDGSRMLATAWIDEQRTCGDGHRDGA